MTETLSPATKHWYGLGQFSEGLKNEAYTTFWEMARRLGVAPRRKHEQARLEKAS